MLYKGAYPSDLSTGKAQLRELGVTTVYDLRSDTEIERYDTPCPEIDGVEIARIPVFKVEDYSPPMMAKCVPSCSYAIHRDGHSSQTVRAVRERKDRGIFPLSAHAFPLNCSPGFHGALLANTRPRGAGFRGYIQARSRPTE